MSTCYFCKGRVLLQKTRHIHRWGERVFILEDVPAEVCQQCGEVYFSPPVLEAMDHIVEGNTAPKTTVAVPVYSLA